MKKTMNFIESLNIYENDYVVLACSYGPDSMVLLDLLKKFHFKIVVAHVNHKLRSDSDTEQKLLEEFCNKNNIIFELFEIKDYPKGNLEMNARNIRYNFFEEIVNKYQAKYLFTAHHGDDLVETILMRLTRGATFGSYAGFSLITRKKGYNLLRPLIFYTKEDIINYAQSNNISYAIDYTNNEDDFTRNRFRHNIIPSLKNENKNVHQKFLKFNELINSYESYFETETNKIYNELYINNSIDLNKFFLLDEMFKKRLLEKILLEIYQDKINIINDKHINLIINLINADKPNAFVVLPKNIKVTKFYNTIIFNFYDDLETGYDYILNKEVQLKDGNILYLDKDIDDNSNFIIRLNSEEISLPLHIRTKKNGDKIVVKNLNGTKKIKDIFIEKKFSIGKRKTYPILTDNNDIVLWIPGVKKSEFDKQKKEKYDIIIKYEKKGELHEK